ncbi:phosphotransferase [Streptomyces sp. A7024]|uniref:Phosphotransferase n=1 Tax=Streptomyces coryli TaxID=1128680 RepID=A0A6G4TYL8_9ACTN|nr:phosphotransferase [Streptomyces coryli]NGN64091.1 phosphotransferase [Streptomyces coryli]
MEQTIARLNVVPGDIVGPLKGNHHETYAVRLGPDSGLPPHFAWVKFKDPRAHVFWFDRRCFKSEGLLLKSLRGRINNVPDVESLSGATVQQFIEGHTLGSTRSPGETVPKQYIDQILERINQAVSVEPYELSHLERICSKRDRAGAGNTGDFLLGLLRYTDKKVYRQFRGEYGQLFDALSIRRPLFRRFRKTVKSHRMASRSFSLLHADLHSENFIIDDFDQLWVIDWELAMIGDPLYELATHLHLMKYPGEQEKEVRERWREAAGDTRFDATAGMDEDLPLLLAYKQLQSLCTDVVRQAMTLRTTRPLEREEQLAKSAGVIHEVLHQAGESLKLPIDTVPSPAAVNSICANWLTRTSR